MGMLARVQPAFHVDAAKLNAQLSEFFKGELERLGLTDDQIEQQSLKELHRHRPLRHLRHDAIQSGGRRWIAARQQAFLSGPTRCSASLFAVGVRLYLRDALDHRSHH